jgi:hypothetical protein
MRQEAGVTQIAKHITQQKALEVGLFVYIEMVFWSGK